MSLHYDVPPNGSLRQGEILRDVRELRSSPAPPGEEAESEIQVFAVEHPLVVVLNSECDLSWDYDARNPDDAGELQSEEVDSLPKSVPYLFLADLHDEATILGRDDVNAGVLKRMSGNRDERYHRLPPGVVSRPEDEIKLPELFIDFKKTFALPTKLVYDGIGNGEITRVAVIPAVYVHHLSQRFHSFHSRVGLPDEE